jgi:hypothetical protein
VVGGLLLGVAATLLIGSVGTHPQQARPPSGVQAPAEGTPLPGAASPIPPTGSGGAAAGPASGQAGPPACAPADLSVSATTDRARYQPGQTVTMRSSVVSRAAHACTVLARCAPPDVHAIFRPAPGGHSVDWYESSQGRACAQGVAAHVLQPGRAMGESDTRVASMPAGGQSCGTAVADLTAQVFLLGADAFVHAVQGTSTFSVAGPACPSPTPKGPLR